MSPPALIAGGIEAETRQALENIKSVLEKNRKKFPVRPGQFTIDQLGLGGWDKVQRDFFDPDRGVIAAIERKVGGATG